MASPRSSKPRMAATGPKGSWLKISALSGTSPSTVGAKKLPAPPSEAPPVSSLAPCFCASSIRWDKAVTRRGLASGPICVPWTRPSPTLRPSAWATMARVNSSRTLLWTRKRVGEMQTWPALRNLDAPAAFTARARSEEHTSELQSQSNLVCRLLLEKKKISTKRIGGLDHPHGDYTTLHNEQRRSKYLCRHSSRGYLGCVLLKERRVKRSH